MDYDYEHQAKTIESILDYCTQIEDRITEVIALRGHWEIWLQCEVGAFLKRLGYAVELEVPYNEESSNRLDILALHDGNSYALELKVESSCNPGLFAGGHLYRAGGDDIFKVREYAGATPVHDDNKLVMVVGHTPRALQLQEELSIDTPPSHFQRGVSIGVSVYHANYY